MVVEYPPFAFSIITDVWEFWKRYAIMCKC